MHWTSESTQASRARSSVRGTWNEAVFGKIWIGGREIIRVESQELFASGLSGTSSNWVRLVARGGQYSNIVDDGWPLALELSSSRHKKKEPGGCQALFQSGCGQRAGAA